MIHIQSQNSTQSTWLRPNYASQIPFHQCSQPKLILNASNRLLRKICKLRIICKNDLADNKWIWENCKLFMGKLQTRKKKQLVEINYLLWIFHPRLLNTNELKWHLGSTKLTFVKGCHHRSWTHSGYFSWRKWWSQVPAYIRTSFLSTWLSICAVRLWMAKVENKHLKLNIINLAKVWPNTYEK